MTAPLSADDLATLQEIAELNDDEGIVSDEEGDHQEQDSSFGSDDDSLFDFIEDDGDWTSISFAKAEAIVDDGRHPADALVNNVRETNVATELIDDEHASTLKRAAPVDVLHGESTKDKPAKMNKSFSDGLDEAFGRVSLETVPDEEAPTSSKQKTTAPRDRGVNDADIEAHLAVEQEIKQTVVSQQAAQSSRVSLPEFSIPADVLQKAILSNKSGPQIFWSHTLYRGPFDRSVTLHYCRTREESEKVASSFLHEPIIGFDMEWCTQWDKSLAGLKRQVSLIQIASEDRVALFHIALHKGDTVNELIAPSLRELLETPTVLKTGVAVWRADGKRLRRFFGIHCQGLIELSNLHQLIVTPDVKDLTSHLRKLADQVKGILKLPLLKDGVRTSNWARELNDKQIKYAADDAYAGYMLFRHMDARRSWMRPMRKRPEFAELEMPLHRQYNLPMTENTPRTNSHSTSDRPGTGQDVVSHSAPKSTVTKRPDFEDDRDMKLYKALCDHRATVVPENQTTSPRRLLGDAVLQNIVAARPTNVVELGKVSGVGPTRISAHGDAWLRIVSEHTHLWATSPIMEAGNSGFIIPSELPDYSSKMIKKKAVIILNESDDDDDEFETMQDRNSRVTPTRWVV